MSVLKFFDYLADGEDDELWDTFYKFYGPLLQISCVFPSWRRSKIPLGLAVLSFYAFIIPVHIWLMTIAIQGVKDDFNLASMEFHYWMLLMFTIIAILLMNNHRDSMITFHRGLSRDVGFHGPGRIYDEDFPMRLERNKNKQLLQFLFLPGLVLVLAGATLIIPFLSKMDGTVLYNDQGVNMKLPIPMRYPFPTHEGILSMVAVLGQFLAAGGLSAVIVTLDLIIFRATQSVIFEYRVLRYAIDTLIPRAKRLYVQEYPMMDVKRVKITDDTFQICIGKCLRACVVHHQEINRLINLYKVMLKWPGFMAYGFGTAVIGLSLINILSAKENGDYENIVLFSGLSLAEVLNMLMMSVFGEMISTQSKELRQELYFIEWRSLNKLNRKLMLGFQMGLNNPVIMKVGGLVTVSLETFSSIMNTSYSFFNLVNAQ